MKLHPNWTFMFWDKEKINELIEIDEFLMNDFILRWNLSGLKDLISSKIKYQYGGFFIDVDVFCIKPLDELAHRFRFVAAI